MCPHKEPRFFAFVDEKLNFCGPGDAYNINCTSITQFDDYLRLFKDVKNEVAIGEASPIYLHLPKAAHQIKQYLPDIKIIAILRNPIERAYSDYLFRRKNGNEPCEKFLEALKLESSRLQNGWSPMCSYLEKGFYFKHLSRFYSLFPTENIRVYTHEQLKTNINLLLKDIFAFLNVDTTFTPDTSIRFSASGVSKSEFIQNLLNFSRKSKTIKNLSRLLMKPRRLNEVYNILQNTNLAKAPKISWEAENFLLTSYEQDITQISTLINCDLSDWLNSNYN